jgi:hypothetical protein
MAKIKGGESGGNDPYHETYGGGHFGWQGIPNTGSGAYGFVKSTWDRAASQWTAAHPGSPPPEFGNPKDQDEIARFWAQKRYHDKTGRDLKTDAAVGKVDYSALESEWPSLTPNHAMHVGWADEDRTKHQGAMDSSVAIQREMMRLASEELPGSKERQELLFRAREAADRASESFDQLRKTPPYYKPADIMENFGSAAVLISIIGGLFARRPLTASLQAAGLAMQAQSQQRWDLFKSATDQWKTQADMGLAQSKLAHDQIREVMDDEKLAFNEREAKISRLLSAWQMGETSKWHDETFRAQRMDAWQRANEHAAEMQQRWEMHADTMQGAVAEKKKEQDIADEVTAARQRVANGEPGADKALEAAIQKRDDFNAARGKSGAEGIKEQVYAQQRAAHIAAGDDPATASTKAAQEAGISRPSQGATGQFSKDAIDALVKQAIMAGPQGVMASLPRGGPARAQFENAWAEELRKQPGGIEGGVAQALMNQLHMAEAKAAATTAGRITMQTSLYAKEAEGAGQLVKDASKAFDRTNYPRVNDAIIAWETNTGDPRVVKLGLSVNALYNAYGKLSNPTGTGIHDADKDRISKILDARLADGQIDAAVDQILLEGRNVSTAATQAQVEVLANLAPHPGGAPGAPAPQTAAPGGVIKYDAQGNRVQ